jgi:hypothetical protein
MEAAVGIEPTNKGFAVLSGLFRLVRLSLYTFDQLAVTVPNHLAWVGLECLVRLSWHTTGTQ